jgi:tetratricopeptide (TPR) repeat protein
MNEWYDINELTEKVEELIELGLFDEAMELLEKYSPFFQDEWEFYFLFARIYLEKGENKEAIPYLHKSLRIDNKNLDVLLSLFFAYFQINKTKKATKYLFRAQKYYPDEEPVLSSLIWYYSSINQFDKAIKCFEIALEKGTENPETFRNAAIAYERIGDYENAESCLLTTLQLNPNFDEARDFLSDHYIFIGKPEKAVSLYQEYLKYSPNNIRALSRLVFCLTQCNKLNEALNVAEQITKLYPNSPIGYVDCAYVYLNEEKLDLALLYSEKALNISPLDAEALRVKAIVYSEKKDYKKAQKCFESALLVEPDNPEILRDYYNHLYNCGKFKQMEKIINNVIKLEKPYCIEEYWFLSDYYRERGDNLKAFHYLNKAYKNMPAEKELIPALAEIMINRGHLLLSIPLLKRYEDLSGWNNIMDQFARNKRLKGKWTQEGFRFLRYYGQGLIDFRKYVLHFYIKKYFIAGMILLFPFLAVFSYIIKGLFGVIFISILAVSVAIGWKTAKMIFRW